VPQNEYSIVTLAPKEVFDLFYLFHLSLMNFFDSAHNKMILKDY
jgi:hypothetical protein